MKTTSCSRSGLYPKLLGDSWDCLHEALQRLHGSNAPVHAVGVLRVCRGSNALARLLARLARLPAAGEAVDIQLQISTRGSGQEWRRMFAGRPLVSLQYERPEGLLGERIKILEMRFRLKVIEASLHYQSRSAALCLGALRVPLPRWISPRILAWEKPVAQGEQIAVSVEVRLPLLGRLIAYDGKLTRIEARE